MVKLSDPAHRSKPKRIQRILAKREPKLVEDVKKVLLLPGSNTSQLLKDVVQDLQSMKKRESVKLTRKNQNMRPFEPGNEASLEFYADKAECGCFVLMTHTKKRPHNLTFGRIFDKHVYDLLELGVKQFTSIKSFGKAATGVSAFSKPCLAFVGAEFENEPAFQLAKSLLLDLFRGMVVDNVCLRGLDHIILVAAVEGRLQLRQYAVALKRNPTNPKVPRTELAEMGPFLDLELRRHRAAPPELEKEALRAAPARTKKKEKNVSTDPLDGKVGRIYLPHQDVTHIATKKMKGVGREKREAAAARKRAAQAAPGGAPQGDAGRAKKRKGAPDAAPAAAAAPAPEAQE